MSTKETIHARPISYVEIQALAQRDAQPVTAYLVEESRAHGLTLTAATLTPKPAHNRAGEEIPFTPVHKPVENPRYDPENTTRHHAQYIADTDVVLGHRVDLGWETMFGTQSSIALISTPEAEAAAPLFEFFLGRPGSRESVYIADSKAPEMPLTPVYGAEATLRFIVKDLDHEEVAKRAEAALRAEFGDALPRLLKVLTRPVKDQRVNVTLPDYRGGERIVAANVLAAEASSLGLSSYTTTEVDPDMIVG